MHHDSVDGEHRPRNQRPIISRFPAYLVGIVGVLLFELVRLEYGPKGEHVTVGVLARWWLAQFAYFAAVFIVFMGLFLLPLRKRLRRRTFVTSVCNLFMACMLF